MQKILVLLAVIGGVFFAVPPAKATIVATLDIDSVLDLLVTADIEQTVQSATKDDFVDYRTTVSTNLSSIAKRNSSLFFTNSKGVQKQKIGASSSILIKKGSNLYLGDNAGKFLIIDRTNNGNTKGAFVFNVENKKMQPFTPLVTSIIATSVTPDGTRLALLGTNAKGKQRVFVSKDHLWELTQLRLPTYAEACSEISIAPNRKTLQLGCRFSEPGKTSDQLGSVFVRYENNKYGKQSRWIENVLLNQSAWLSNSRVITIETSIAGTTINELLVQKGNVTEKNPLGGDTSVIVDGVTYASTPSSLARISDVGFLFTYTVGDLSNLVQTAIGYHERPSGTSHWVVNDDKVRLLLSD